MSEKTNDEIYNKMVEAFNMVLEETHTIRSQNSWANDHIDHINSNTRTVFSMVDNLQKEIKQLRSLVRTLEEKIGKLK
jgi:hypothetical protein